MEVTAKPGADLLWAFQLHREHRALSKRLTAVETSAAQQQERIAASEQNIRSEQHGRIDALTERLRKLESADVSEQVAGLASELRTTRQQLEQARDKVKLIEQANKEADIRNQDKEREVQTRLEEFASAVAQTQSNVHVLEDRLGLAVDAAGRAAANCLASSSERYEEQLRTLSEQLHSLERVQGGLRTLIDSDRPGLIVDPVSASKGPGAPHIITEQGTTFPIFSPTQDRNKHEYRGQQAMPEPSAQVTMATDMPAPQRSSNVALPIAKKPGVAVQKSTVSSKGKRKRDFEKEISQLIHGDGFLTNAPIILESQEPGATTRASKKLKAEVADGMSLRSGFTQQAVTTNNIKKEPIATRIKVLAKPAVNVVAGRRTAAKTAAKRSAPQLAATTTQERKDRAKSKKAPVPEKPLSSMSNEIQVAHSRTPSASKQLPHPPNFVAPSLPLMSEEKATKQQEQRPKQRRRRIEQDDSMEEFLAKCEAAANE